MNPLKLLHTGDWHLGHQLHGQSREAEHRDFLAFLLTTLMVEQIHGLLVCGDVFDTANPPASAEKAFYDFVLAARKARPELHIVVIAGNHDSPRRMEAPRGLLERLGCDVRTRYLPQSQPVDFALPLGVSGHTRAWVAAVPFLRPADLPLAETGAGVGADGAELLTGVAEVYRRVLGVCHEAKEPDQPVIALGHGYWAGGKLSELSERKVMRGNQFALPVDMFDNLADYVALGHLHLAQAVGERPWLRYAGSPLPLSMTERTYPHQVRLVAFEGTEMVENRAIKTPRTRTLTRVPNQGALELEELKSAVNALSFPKAGLSGALQPLVELSLLLDVPQPGAKEALLPLVEATGGRLAKLSVTYTGSGLALPEQLPQRALSELQPEEVFRARYREQFRDKEPAEALMQGFHSLLEAAQAGEA